MIYDKQPLDEGVWLGSAVAPAASVAARPPLCVVLLAYRVPVRWNKLSQLVARGTPNGTRITQFRQQSPVEQLTCRQMTNLFGPCLPIKNTYTELHV